VEDPTVELPEPIALPPHRRRFGEQDPILTGRVTGATGESLPGASITVTDWQGRQLLHSRTDENGEYAATGFHSGSAVVVAGAPGHQPIAQPVQLDPAVPTNLNFALNIALNLHRRPARAGSRPGRDGAHR
jgi:hypothetical protein